MSRARYIRRVIELDTDRIEVDPDGRVFAGTIMHVSPETLEQIRQGYECIQCWEPFENAFPEKCPVCGFPVKERQLEELGQKHDPNVHDPGSQLDWDAELDRLEERKERRAFAKRAAESNIVVPELWKPE